MLSCLCVVEKGEEKYICGNPVVLWIEAEEKNHSGNPPRGHLYCAALKVDLKYKALS